MRVQQIREKSIRTAKRLGVDVPPTLPLLDPDLEMRSIDECLDRLLTMNAVAAIAYGFDRAKAVVWLKRESLTESLSKHERDFVFEGVGQPSRFQVQVEGMWALAWATGTVNEMDFVKDCDPRFAAMLPNLKQNQNSAEFRKRASLRSLEQIVAACDLAYCLHWALRQAELSRTRAPANLKLYLLVERRRALEWFLSKEAWDEVSLDT